MFITAIRSYLCDEYTAHHPGQVFDVNSFTSNSVSDIPLQDNSSDCGLFTCKYADYISDGLMINSNSFTCRDMRYFRQRITCEIKYQRVI